METKKTITAYKGFDKDLKCRGFQYEVGKNYKMDEEGVECCTKGFHACENPMDVFEYYFIGENGEPARFCEVEQYGRIDKDGKKQASSEIKIKAEIKFADFIKLAFEYMKKKVLKTGYSGGDRARIASEGDGAQIASGGDRTRIASGGDGAKIASGGDNARIASGGYGAQIASGGDYAQIASGGGSARIASGGDGARIASGGDYAQIASGGDGARIASCGYNARIASSGHDARIASGGDDARIASGGHCARIASGGGNSVIMCAGSDSAAKAKKGSWITLTEWGYNNENKYIPVCVKTERVDGERIKEDTWYMLKKGEFKEVE